MWLVIFLQFFMWLKSEIKISWLEHFCLIDSHFVLDKQELLMLWMRTDLFLHVPFALILLFMRQGS